MFTDKINELKDINVALNVTTAWYRKNMPDYDELLPHLLEINSRIPIGPGRDRAYRIALIDRIVKAGFSDQFAEDTVVVIIAADQALKAYIEKLEKLSKNNAAIYDAISRITDKASLTPALEQLMQANRV